MVNDNDGGFDTHIFKSYKKHKEYRQKIEQQDRVLVDENYFNCIYCGKVNLIKEIINEEIENRTMRARYLTWKKFKDISNLKGGTLENGLNYLISLHEQRKKIGNDNDSHEIGIAGFGGGDKI